MKNKLQTEGLLGRITVLGAKKYKILAVWLPDMCVNPKVLAEPVDSFGRSVSGAPVTMNFHELFFE